MKSFGERIRKARLAKGLSLTEASRGACTKTHLSAIELGKARPSVELLVRLSRTLGLPIKELALEYASETPSPRGLLELCKAARLSGDPETSLVLLERLCQQAESASANPAIHLELGHTYFDLRRLRDARRAFATAVDAAYRHNIWPVHAEALLHLGIVCLLLGEFKDAMESLMQSVRATPRSAGGERALFANYCLAICLSCVGMHKRAADLYAEVCDETVQVTYESTPLRALAYLGLAVAHSNRQKYDDALRANAIAGKILRSSGLGAQFLADVSINQAIYLLDLGESERAEPSLRQGLDLLRGPAKRFFEDRIVMLLTEFARLHLQRQRLSVAKRIAGRALALAEDYGENPFRLGRLHVLLAALCPDEAEQHKTAALELGRQLTMPGQRISFYSLMGRLLRNTEFEAIGVDFLDEAIRESENLVSLGAE